MAGQTHLSDALGRTSSLYDRYASAAAERLASDPLLRRAREEWERFLVDSHGAVFEGLDVEDPRETLFVDSLYYDFVVDRLLERAERRFDVRLVNPEPAANTDALSFEFRALHETILEDVSVGGAADGAFEAVDLVHADAGTLRDLYESVVPREMRLELGQYYTPRGVAELAVGELDVDDHETETFLDPGCGSGVFLATCIDEKRAALEDRLDPDALVDVVTDAVLGFDLNPVAVKSAKLCYVCALSPLLEAGDVDRVEVPVFLTDALRLTRTDELRYGGGTVAPTVDHLVGNPPWMTWGDLPDAVKDAWRRDYAERLDLLPHGGAASRLGHCNDDVSLPFVWVCVHRYLAEGGDASFVLKRAISKGPAGRLLRTGAVGDRPVAVTHVHDFNDLRPFGEAVSARAAVYTLCADEEPTFPIPTASWTAGEDAPRFSSADAIRETLVHESTGLVPVDADDPSSSWVRADAERRALGDCEHRVRHGVKDDAKDVFALDRGQLDALEPDHVYPYVRSRHVVKYGLFGYDLHLVPMRRANEDNEAALRERCPRTYDYLESNRERLESRSSSWLRDGPFYSVFGLGEYTWSAYKVVWCRLGFKPHFAVVSTVEDEDLGRKPVVPGDHCMFVSTDDEYEAHFLCALLNAAPYQQCIEGIASAGKSSLSKAVVSKLELPAYRATPRQRRLAELSMAAHDVVPGHTDVSKREYNATTIDELEPIQAEIDLIVEELLAGGAPLATGPARDAP